MKLRGRKRKKRWGLLERVGSSIQQGAGLGEQEGVYLVGALLECWVMDAAEAEHQRLSPLGGGGLEVEEVGDPSELGGGEEACLCGEMMPGAETKMERSYLDDT